MTTCKHNIINKLKTSYIVDATTQKKSTLLYCHLVINPIKQQLMRLFQKIKGVLQVTLFLHLRGNEKNST